MQETVDRFRLVNFATPNFFPYRDRLVASAERHGVEVAELWDRERLATTEFYAAHKTILDNPRGAGFWLWKPYVILEALRSSPPDALVLYADSVIEILDDLAPLGTLLREGDGIMVFQDGHYLQNKSWTKRDAFVLMDCDTPRYWFAPQLQAAIMAFRNTEPVREFVEEWLRYCEDPRILTEQPNEMGLPNWLDCVAHRHDQSVLTNLIHRRGILPYRELTDVGRDFTIHMDYRDHEGTDHSLEYRMAPSPYGILVKRWGTRPSAKRSILRRVLHRVYRTLRERIS